MFVSVFAKTFAALALAALGVAATLKWDTPTEARTSAFVVGFSLLMALIGAVIAALWSIVATPATTVWGKAIRSGIQALLSSPLAVVVGSALGWEDFENIGNLILPTAVGILIAVVTALLSNAQPVPTTDVKPLGADVLGTDVA